MANLRYEDAVQSFGKRIFESMGRKKPSVFAKDYWQGQMMEWCMRNDAFKTEMFRFVDVFPVLNQASDVAKHLQEYFCRPGQDVPKAFQWGLSAVSPSSRVAKIAAGQIEKNIAGMAYRFIVGEDATSALPKLASMRAEGIAFTVDLLGEACVSEAEADDYQQRYFTLIRELATATADWPADAAVEGERFPRVNISIKPSALYSHFDAINPEGSYRHMAGRLRAILREAKKHDVFVNLDVESSSLKDLTFAIFKRLLEEDEFADGPQAGVVVQAYLRDSSDDLKELIKWAKKRKRRIAIRLVKGAYWDYEVIHAQQNDWPIPVYVDKRQTDENFEACTALLMENVKHVIPAIASHNVRSLAHAMACAERHKVGRDEFEFQALYGMAEPLKTAMRALDYRLRDYVPIGELVPGMGYLVRRLLENTSNESWLRQGFAENLSVDDLLGDPRDRSTPPRTTLVDPKRGTPAPRGASPFYQPFFNEPPADFSTAAAREAYADALTKVRKRLGGHYPLVIDGKKIDTECRIVSTNPANPSEVIGTTAQADVALAEQAVQAAKRAFPAWRDTSPERRAKVLFDTAAELRKARYELCAIMTLEVGKQWREADGDVCEAIDFLEYYGREMLRLGVPQRLGFVPGELNHLSYQPRGVAAVIAPWNFPLAILTGMTSAALVAGNCVVMKPAGQSPIIAARLMQAFEKAGVPQGVLNFVPGPGSAIGPHLTTHPDVSLIAFTGSMEVGLGIYAEAAKTPPKQLFLKRVICELGGKNAVIVDSDADLDEAVVGIVKSAFGFQGQKCSACSRAIVLDANYDAFVGRLIEAVRSLEVGPSEDPRFHMGPVVDGGAQRDILATIEHGKTEAKLAIQAAIPAGEGFYVPPTVFVDVDVHARIAQEEIFGPVLAVIRARDFEHALEIAAATPYALTGGVFSRSPDNIARAREAFRVGNLYINRGTTGALVWRNPFGGSMRSGVGSKAGGPDYLLQFMDPRAITENTMRRGFAPIDTDAA